MNYYEVLEVSKTASQEIIKIAYKNLAKKVLTFPRKFDKIHKLTRAGTQRDGTEP